MWGGERETAASVKGVKAPVHFLTQSCDQISCCGKPVGWTNETAPEMIQFARSTGFPQRLIGSQGRVRDWIRAFSESDQMSE